MGLTTDSQYHRPP